MSVTSLWTYGDHNSIDEAIQFEVLNDWLEDVLKEFNGLDIATFKTEYTWDETSEILRKAEEERESSKLKFIEGVER